MPRLKGVDQLEAFRKQQVELAKRIKAAEARQRDKDRADDLRRKQVLGAAVLEFFARPDQERHRSEFLKAMFDGHAMSATDRALFKELLGREMPEAAKNVAQVAAEPASEN